MISYLENVLFYAHYSYNNENDFIAPVFKGILGTFSDKADSVLLLCCFAIGRNVIMWHLRGVRAESHVKRMHKVMHGLSQSGLY